MKNILSFENGTKFTGQEILDWANYQIKNNTSHYKQGQRLLKIYGKTLNPVRNYWVYSQYETFGVGDVRHKPLIIKCM